MIICELQSLSDRKLVYRDKEGILDRYTYLYCCKKIQLINDMCKQ